MFAKKTKIVIVFSLFILTVLAGCTGKDTGSPKSVIDPDKPVTLKVAYINDQMFYQTYGNYFSTKYPNVQFEVIPTMGRGSQSGDAVEQIRTILDTNQPDVVVLTMEQYEALAAQGRLYDLESMIRQSRFDIENMVEGVIDLLRDAGGGKLYGLAPSFTTEALYYNKDLFAKYGVPEPTDRMSWEEVIQLAARFPSDGDDDSRIYGLASSMFSQSTFELIQKVAASKGLNYLNPDATLLTMEGSEWKQIFKMVIEGFQNKSISIPASLSMGQSGGRAVSGDNSSGPTIRIGGNSQLFIAGRAAMVVDSSSTLNMMNIARGNFGRGNETTRMNWGVVTVPVDKANPDLTSAYSVSQIFAVNAASPQTDVAWEFVKYVHSEENAKIRARTSTELISRKGFTTDSNGNNLEVFYKLRPMPMETTRWYPRGFRASFNEITKQEIEAAVNNEKSVDEAFSAILSRGQEALTEANMSGEKEQAGGGFGDMGFVQQIFMAR